MTNKEEIRFKDLEREIELLFCDAENNKKVILDEHVHKFRELNSLHIKLLIETNQITGGIQEDVNYIKAKLGLKN